MIASKRALQTTVAVLSLVPLGAGLAGCLSGPAMLSALQGTAPPIDLDSHFRYLSGLLLGIGLLFLSTIPKIETQSARFRLGAIIVFIGGLGRLLGLIQHGAPSIPHFLGLSLELGVVPLLALWQHRLATTRLAGLDRR